MPKNILNLCVEAAQKPAYKFTLFYTNTQPVSYSQQTASSYTQFVAQVFYSLLHVVFSKLYLLFKVVHTFPSAYNYNYIYLISNRSSL